MSQLTKSMVYWTKKYGCFNLHCNLHLVSQSLSNVVWTTNNGFWCRSLVFSSRYFRDHKCFNVGSYLTDRMTEKLQLGNKIASVATMVSLSPIIRRSRNHNASLRCSSIASTVQIRMLAVAGGLASAEPTLIGVGQEWLALASRFRD